MEHLNLILLAVVGIVVVAPLAREYADLRRAWGFGRLPALATTLLVLPSLGVGLHCSGRPRSSWPWWSIRSRLRASGRQPSGWPAESSIAASSSPSPRVF